MKKKAIVSKTPDIMKKIKKLYPYQGKMLFQEDLQEIIIIQTVKEGFEKIKEFKSIDENDTIFTGISAFDLQPLEIKARSIHDWELYKGCENIDNLEFKNKILHTELVRLKSIVVQMLRADFKINLV